MTKLNTDMPLVMIGDVQDFDYTKVSHYVYCYLDPTKMMTPSYEMSIELYDEIDPNAKDTSNTTKNQYNYDFFIEPMYIGRAVNFKGFRLYMHLSEYLRHAHTVKDKRKYERMDKINKWLIGNGLDWRWYKTHCIVVLVQILGTSSVNHDVAIQLVNYKEKEIIKQLKKDGVDLANIVLFGED